MNEIYQHFRASEKYLIDSGFDWIEWVQRNYAPYLTDFLNPRERHIIMSLVNQQEDIDVAFYGGLEDAESKRALLYPTYFIPTNEDYHITLFEIDYPSQFTNINHGQVLGTLMGAGLKREVIGDIITDGERVQFFAEDQLEDYIRMSVNRIGKNAVIIKKTPIENQVEPVEHYETRKISVSSLRLDVIIAGAFNFSRQIAKSLINSEKVKMNWEVINQAQVEVDFGDMISVRGYGRMRLIELNGESRKGKLQLTISKLSNKR